VDGTLTDTTIVPPLIWMKRRYLPAPARLLWVTLLAVRVPWWLLLDRFSRRASNLSIYACYRGLPALEALELGKSYYTERIRSRLFKPALERLKVLQQSGLRAVLVTGGLDFLMTPLARELDADCIARTLEEREGLFTGGLIGEPLTGAGKALEIERHASLNGIDLGESHAWGDAIGDLPMLEIAGYPLAVNPDRRLAAVARRRGWEIASWQCD
jgi:alcohol-forming fatty acyl-CoA reductase